MSHEISLPDNILDELKCTLCNEYLSYFPIHSYSSDGVVACGRCPLLEEDNPSRDIAYERVAKQIIFPCKYKTAGCFATHKPEQLSQHEDTCTFRQYFCPLIPLGTCNWQGPIDELYQHYSSQHHSLVLNNLEFTIHMMNKVNTNYMLMHDNYIFIVHVNCNNTENKIYIGLRFLGNKSIAEQYAYQVSLYRTDMKPELPYCKDVVQCDNDVKLNKDEAIIIRIEDLQTKLFEPLFVACKIHITNKISRDNSNADAGETTPPHEYNEGIIKTLECPVCFNPMVPPIYQCVIGHSVCECCKTQLKDCPTCHADIGNTRNYLLEEITKHFKYPCKYREYNCTHVSTANDIKEHETGCVYGPFDCPYKDFDECNWNGKLETLLVHVQSVHKDSLLDLETLTTYLEADVTEEIFVVYRCKELFKLLIKHDADVYYLSVQLIGPAASAKHYIYEIDFANADTNERNYYKRPCASNTFFDDAFGDDNCLKLPAHMVEPYVKNNILNFKYHIYRVAQ